MNPVIERFDSENQNDKDGSLNETAPENDEPESETIQNMEFGRKMTKIQQFIRSFKGSIHN